MSRRGTPLALLLPALIASASAMLALLGGCELASDPVFPHNAHLETQACDEPGKPACPTCRTCHEGLWTSEARPVEPVSSCAECHTPVTASVQWAADQVGQEAAPRQIAFSHVEHAKVRELSDRCELCHAGVARDGESGDILPGKPTCLRCHEAELTAGRCRTCHLDRSYVRQVPRTFLRHDRSFLEDHGEEAGRAPAVCSECHTQASCTGCHDTSQSLAIEVREPEAVDRGFVHRADFVGRHAIEARLGPADCLRCHEISTCDGCHVERGVSGNRAGAANPHPIGWVGPDDSSPSFHGRPARRDIVSCAGCHDQGPSTNCIRCHKVGGPGGSPHPDGWSSARSPQAATCRYCHAR